MSIFNSLFGRKATRTDPRQLLRAIEAFIQADTWDGSRRVVEQHPELLTDEAEEVLAQLVRLARAQGNEDAVQIFEEHRALLRRCREVGVARAFAEKMLPPAALAAAERLGLTPEQALEMARLAAEMPPELWEVLAELAASGAEIRSPEDLARLLSERPDLRAKLEAVVFAGFTRPSEEEIRRHPLYPLAESTLRGEIPLEEALRRATARETLAALDDAAIDRMDDFIIALSRNPARPTRDRVLAYLLAELNHAAAQALPASPPIRAYTANTLGNRIDDFPYQDPGPPGAPGGCLSPGPGDLAGAGGRPAGSGSPEQPGHRLLQAGPGAGAGGEPAAGHPGLPGGPANAG